MNDNYKDYWNDNTVCGFLDSLWKVPEYQAERQTHADIILSKTPSKILDIGSGSGILYKELKNKDSNINDIYRAVDISQTFIDLFTSKYPEVDVTLEDAEHLPFNDNTYEAVAIYDVLRHQPNYKVILTEALRVSSKYVFIIETFVDNENHEDLIITYKWNDADIYDNWYSRIKMTNFIKSLYTSCSVEVVGDRMLLTDIRR